MLHNMAKPSAKRSKKKTCKSRKRKCQHVCFPGPVEEDVIVFDGDLSQTHVPGFETGSLHHTPRGTSGEDVPHISRGTSAQDTPHTPTREQAAPHVPKPTHEKGMSGHTNPVSKPDTAFFKYDDVTYNMGNVNLYEADTLFHAVAMSLMGSTKKWSSIEKDGTNLGSFILRRLDDYSAAGGNGERVDHMFVRWLVIEYLKNADETDNLFKRASTRGYEHCTITAADISELRKQALSSQKDKEEVHAYVKIEHQMELVLHLAFGGLITIIRLLKKESTISFADMYDRNCSGPKTDDKSFLFLERNNFMEQSDGSFMLNRSELQEKLASGAFVEARSPSVKTNKPENQCHEMRSVPQTQGGSSDICGFEYDGTKYHMGKVDVHETESLFHAVALSLLGSADKWSSIEKDETNLCHFLLQKLRTYKALGSGGTLDHMFIRWLVAAFLNDIGQTKKHEIFRTTTGFRGNISRSEIDKYRRYATIPNLDAHEQQDLVQNRHRMEFLLHAAFEGLITIVRPVTEDYDLGKHHMWKRVSSRPGTDDRSFILLSYRKSLQLSDKSFMLTRADLKNPLYVLGGSTAAQGEKEAERSQSQPPQTGLERQNCADMQIVPTDALLKRDMAVFKYEALTYNVGEVHVHEAESFFHAVALGLLGSADKWASIDKDETNLCYFLLQKLGAYKASRTGGTFDHMFIRWLVANFLDDVRQDNEHDIFRSTADFGGNISMSEIDDYIRFATNDKPTPAEQQLFVTIKPKMEFLLHTALKGLVTIVRPVTVEYDLGEHQSLQRVSSRPQTDDRSFILLNYRKTLQLSDTSFMLTRAELMRSPIYVPKESAAPPGEQEAERQAPPPPNRKRTPCDRLQRVPETQAGSLDISAFEYGGIAYNTGKVDVHQSETLFHAVALSLRGSVNKWPSITKDGKNLCSFLLEKLIVYKEEYIGGEFDHMFIRWLIRQFLDSVSRDNGHYIFRDDDDEFESSILYSEIKEYERMARTQDLASHQNMEFRGSWHHMEFLLHAALQGLVTVVLPITDDDKLQKPGMWRRVRSRPHTDDKSFIFLNYSDKSVDSIQLPDKSFMMTRAELLQSPHYIPKESAAEDEDVAAAEDWENFCNKYQKSPVDGPKRTEERSYVKYQDRSYNTGMMTSYDVAGDGQCFYHAVALCLSASADKWWAVERGETNLCSVLNAKLVGYASTKRTKRAAKLDAGFVKWLITDFPRNVDDQHELFGKNDEIGLPVLVFDSENGKDGDFPATTKMILDRGKASGRACYGGKEEAYILHYALHGLVTIVMMAPDTNSILGTHAVCSHKMDDQAFIFLKLVVKQTKTYDYEHWNSLKHSESGSFLMSVKDFKEKAMYDKCNEDIIEINSRINLSTFKVPYPRNSELMVYKTTTRTFHEAVAVCLAQHRIRGEWSNAMCNILREKYHEFILLGGGDNTDFVRFVGNANDSGSKTEDESMDGIDGIEGSQDGFQGNTRVYLHRSTGLVPRKTKPRSSDHADLTYELHVYQDESKEYHPIVLGQQVEDDQIHTPTKVIDVLSGVFHGVMQNRPVPWDVQGYLLGYDLGKCKSEDIVVASKTPPNVKQCGLVDMKLVGFDGRTGVPSLATRPGEITWRTTVRRELDRADLLFIIVATGMKSSPEEATTFYMGNGVIWKVTLKRHALHHTPHYKHNLIDELNKLFDRVDAYSGDRLDMGHGTGVPRMSLDQKLAAVRKFLRCVGLKGSVEVMQYRGIEQMGDGKDLFGVATARATFLKNMEKNKSLQASKEGIRYTSENAITASYADVFTVRKTRTNARTVSADDFDEVEERLVEERLQD